MRFSYSCKQRRRIIAAAERSCRRRFPPCGQRRRLHILPVVGRGESSMAQAGAWTSYKEQVRHLAGRLVEAQRPIRIREAISWDDEVESRVIASRFKELPQVDRE